MRSPEDLAKRVREGLPFSALSAVVQQYTDIGVQQVDQVLGRIAHGIIG